MTQEEKSILFKDLCARLPYGVQLKVTGGEFDLYSNNYLLTAISKFGLETKCKVYHPVYTPMGCPNIENAKPYLRPMSSMTDEEMEELQKEHLKDEKLFIECINKSKDGDNSMRGKVITHFAADWCHRNHFDYRGLIPMGLALEASGDMYNN